MCLWGGTSHSNHSGEFGFYFVVGGFVCLFLVDWLSLFASVSSPGWTRIPYVWEDHLVLLILLPYLLSAGITDVGYHAWFIWCRRRSQGLPESSTLPTEPHSQGSGPFQWSLPAFPAFHLPRFCSQAHGERVTPH